MDVVLVSRTPLPRWGTPIDELVAVYKGREARRLMKEVIYVRKKINDEDMC